MGMPAVLSYVLVDTMTDGPFTGNPTPVFLLDKTLPWLPDNKMQLLAREMNHSESVFLRQINASEEYDIVFFTPTAEEPFCGHGILGAAYALSEMHEPGKYGFSFRLRNGIVSRAQISDQPASSLPRKLQLGAVREIAMTFPTEPPNPKITLIEPEVKTITGTDIEEDYASALGLEPKQLLYVAVNGHEDVVIELDSSIDISADKMAIDAVALEAGSPQYVRSQVITTKSSEEGVDFYKRVFAYGSEGMCIATCTSPPS